MTCQTGWIILMACSPKRHGQVASGKRSAGVQPPSPQSNLPRNDVSNVMDAMLLGSGVKWVGIVCEATAGGIDRFIVTPYIVDPMKGAMFEEGAKDKA